VLVADPRWLIGAVPDGLVCVDRVVQIDVGFEATPAQAEIVVDLLAAGLDAERLARTTGSSLDDSRELLELLAARESCTPSAPPPHPRPACPSSRRSCPRRAGEAPTGMVWSGSEALILPDSISPALARRALRAFVAGLADHARLTAYAYAATTARRTVCGGRARPRAPG